MKRPAEPKSGVYFRQPISETTENICFPNCRDFPVLADKNGYQFWFLKAKIHKLSVKILYLDDAKVK